MEFNHSWIRSGGSSELNAKLFVIVIIILSVFVLYLLKLFSMQVLEGSVYRSQSASLASRVKILPAQRGEIYDRNAAVPMVINTDSFAVDMIPGEIPAGHYDTVASRLAGLLNIDKTLIDEKVPQSIRRSFSSVEIRSNVSFSAITNIAENISDLPGISWRSKPIRNYVETGSISHIVGYVGDITKEELKLMYNKGYTDNSIVGKTGIERQYDELLQGQPGSESRTVDVRGRYLAEPPVIKTPQMGKNLILTIDTRIQKLAEEALGERVGAAVVLKPASGEILAMVSYPFYDQNIFSSENASQAYARLASDPHNPLLNRAVNASYPPASTFKVIMTTALLSEKSFPPEAKIECTGLLEYGNRTFRCHIGVPGHGYLDMKNGLAQSCNVYFWTTGRDNLGVDLIASYAKEFGLGQSLEIDLPSQSEGFIPTPQWKERRYHERWLGGDTMSMSIGQGYTLVTPLHIANMMAMVVNKGIIYRPHLLKEVHDPVTNEVLSVVEPEVLHESNVDKAVWTTVQEYLRYTATDGSAQYPIRNKVVQMAGKSGTGEVSQYKDQWHSWFVAYAPYDAPPEEAVVVCVLVEAVNPWEWWAPYATNIIMQGIFANQTYEEAIEVLGFKYLQKPIGRQE